MDLIKKNINKQIFRTIALVVLTSFLAFAVLRSFYTNNVLSAFGKIYQFQFPMPKNLSFNQKIALNEALIRAKENKKIIVEWYSTKQRSFRVSGVCGSCEVVTNRSKINDTDTAAVVFMYREIHASTMPPPSTRRSDQLYVWYSGEAPPSLLLLHRRYFQFEDKYGFNATQTYRRDADIYHPYGNMQAILQKKIKAGYRDDPSRILEIKSKFTLAVMSNCHSLPGANIRLQFLRDLIADGLEVDTFGECFQTQTYSKRENSKFSELLKSYKFYIAFENSYHCRDYITEKFFVNGLDSSAIPIVWGSAKEDYEALAPPGSFIYADDFATTKDLVEYINFLDKNDSAYLQYFSWYNISAENLAGYGRQTRYCQLCRILHGINVDDIFNPNYDKQNPARPLIEDSMSPRRVTSLYDWYYRSENGDCLNSPSRFYRTSKSLAARTLDGRT